MGMHAGFTIARMNDEVYANCVWKHWPAYKAGLRFGDQILRVNGHSVKVRDGATARQAVLRVTT
jgi:C-terminal processing protease CtpA/Prc